MKYNISISCEKSKLSKIREFVASVLERHHISELESHKLILAVDEVCANLIIHANNCNPSENIELGIDFPSHEEIRFEIKDKGVGFDFSKYNEPSIDEIISARKKGGIGLMLVKRIMDEVHFSSEGAFNICHLVKKLEIHNGIK